MDSIELRALNASILANIGKSTPQRLSLAIGSGTSACHRQGPVEEKPTSSEQMGNAFFDRS